MPLPLLISLSHTIGYHLNKGTIDADLWTAELEPLTLLREDVFFFLFLYVLQKHSLLTENFSQSNLI